MFYASLLHFFCRLWFYFFYLFIGRMTNIGVHELINHRDTFICKAILSFINFDSIQPRADPALDYLTLGDCLTVIEFCHGKHKTPLYTDLLKPIGVSLANRIHCTSHTCRASLIRVKSTYCNCQQYREILPNQACSHQLKAHSHYSLRLTHEQILY